MYRWILLFFVSLIGLLCSSCKKLDNKCCECLEENGESDAYVYPIMPGSEEWKKLSSHTAMVEVCQIPRKTLNDMCTFGLIETYYNYPLIFVIGAFNNTKEGMQQMFEEFNGAHELLNRNNAPSKLMAKYDQLNPTDLDTTWTLLEQGNFEFQFTWMELTLAYDPILKALTKAQKSELVHIAVTTYNERMKISPSNWKTLTSTFLIANLLYELQYQPFMTFTHNHPSMNSFIDGYMNNLYSFSEGEREEIVNIINKFLIDF